MSSWPGSASCRCFHGWKSQMGLFYTSSFSKWLFFQVLQKFWFWQWHILRLSAFEVGYLLFQSRQCTFQVFTWLLRQGYGCKRNFKNDFLKEPKNPPKIKLVYFCKKITASKNPCAFHHSIVGWAVSFPYFLLCFSPTILPSLISIALLWVISTAW